MIQAFSPFVALRYLVTRRINLLGALGVAFAVWAMLVVDAVFTGFVGQIRDDVKNSAPALLLTDLPHDTAYEPLRAALVAEPGVAATAPRLRHHGLVQPARVPGGLRQTASSSEVEFHHTDSGFALFLGIDPLSEPQVTTIVDWLRQAPDALLRTGMERPATTVLEEPSPERRSSMLLPDDVEWRARRRARLPAEPRAVDHRSSWPGVLFGARRARRMPWLNPGDPLDLLCAGFVGEGSSRASNLRTHSLRAAFAGAFASGHRMFDETTVIVPIETLRTLLGHDFADPASIELVTDVAIAVDPGLSPAAVQALAGRLQRRIQPLLPPGSPPCSVLDWQQQNPVFLDAVAHEQAMMQFVLFVVMLVAAFVIYATLHMMVVQKVKDIGILAAVGGSPRSIGAVFLLGGTIVAVVGSLLGLGAGVLSIHFLNPLNDWLYEKTGAELFPRRLFDLPEIPSRLEPSWVVGVTIGAVVLAVVVAWLPARKAARMNPVLALSHE